jgi:hypothetical protein
MDWVVSSWINLLGRESNTNYYFDTHANMNMTMRYQLVEWYVLSLIYRMRESSCNLQFKRLTLHLAVKYADLYLSHVSYMYERDLQFLGAGALFLAAKINETGQPPSEEFVGFDWEVEEEDTEFQQEPLYARQLKSQAKLICWEDRILAGTDWKLLPATSLEWLMRYFQIAALAVFYFCILYL